ncbi:macro domain-containing protein [Streptomyces sp. V3I7]|uniref:macro domain-containing protein n=1 Tax=Streptomyces sp. V3I7 TaxID=3042278 RepID=UPI0027878BDD|nr:macro domain-containing protein [Streptomyces sp. V3I7]MDQ0994127.1 O-acetyl-ADP-ribose deacetylase (regulator of RNase III) [Streptomyces sp. V3I7]
MSDIAYVRGDATAPLGPGAKVIAHVCNDAGGWGKGFVLALSRRWPGPEAAYRAWHRDRATSDFGLGAVRMVPVEPALWVANMIGQRGIRGAGRSAPVRYEAIDTALGRLADQVIELGAAVHMPRIGCGLAGGTWSRIEPLITERLVSRGIAVTVYDHGKAGDARRA